MDNAVAYPPTAAAHPDIQAIIARPPARLTRWGNTILLLIVGSLLAATVFIRYAERISLPLQLAAATAPVPVPLGPTAVVGQWSVQPKQWVRQGQLLGYATDGPSVAELLGLAQWLRHSLAAPAAGGDLAGLPRYSQLGELQAGYAALGRSLEPGQSPGISRRAHEQQRATLQRQVQQWLMDHAIRAPATGQFSHDAWKAGDASSSPANKPLSYILPAVRPGTEVGHVLIAQSQLRHVKPQQLVEVSFDAYPAREYGTVRGQIEQIADLPEANGYYQALVRFPHGLRTNSQHVLSFRAGMTATAEMVLAYKPLIQQLFPWLAGPSWKSTRAHRHGAPVIDKSTGAKGQETSARVM